MERGRGQKQAPPTGGCSIYGKCGCGYSKPRPQPLPYMERGVWLAQAPPPLHSLKAEGMAKISPAPLLGSFHIWYEGACSC